VVARRRVTLGRPEDAPATVRPTADLLVRGLTVRGRLATLRFAAAAGAVPAGASPTAEELAASVTPLAAPVEQLRAGPSVRSVAPRPDGAARIAVPADVLFAFGRAEVRPAGRRALVRLAASATGRAGTLRVVGHTDGVGGASSNRRLSLRRARAVAAVHRPGLPASVRIVSTGRGPADPVADERTAEGDDDPDGRARNRRVALRFVR
jgi:outer membrane protein OmpA-like peptidoglycan-associated protein